VPLDAEASMARIRLAGAWTTLIALYIYADFLSLYRPDELEEIGRGRLGPFDVSQGTLVVASLIVMIPAAMIVLSLVLAPAVARWANMVLAVLYTVVNLVNLVGEGWAYYILFGLAEIAVTVLIFFIARKWQVRAPEAYG
jgi:hypothetical protein